MVQSLESICRGVVFRNTCDKMRSHRKKTFLISGDVEHISQCKNITKSMTATKSHRLGQNILMVILN